MKNLVTYWTVAFIALGMDKPSTKYYRNYDNAKTSAMRDYHDRPVKHTVKPENMPPTYLFED